MKTKNQVRFLTRIRLIGELRDAGIRRISGIPLEECPASGLRKKYFSLIEGTMKRDLKAQ